MSIRIALAITIAASLGLTACATDHTPADYRDSFKTLDVNNENFLTREEVERDESLNDYYDRHDVDDDDRLSEAEYRELFNARASAINS